jgi:tape measure domain-containing protein
VASEVLKIDLKASDSTGAAFASLQRSMSGVSKSFATVQSVVKGGLGLLVAGGIGEAIGSIREYADAVTLMTNRLKSAGLTSSETAIAQQKIADIASRSRSSLAEVGNLYARISFATETLGTSQADVSKITETLAKAFKLSGKTALEAQSAVTQLTQALASGVLQGDELRSLRENAPEVARAIADFFGVTVGELKELGAEGQLTADKIVPAILAGSDKIEQRFAQTRSTFEDYGIAIKNFFTSAIGSIQDFVLGTQLSVDAMQQVIEMQNKLRNEGRGVLAAEKPVDPEFLASLKAVEGMGDQAKEVNELTQSLNHLVDTVESPTFISLARGAAIKQIFDPEEITKIKQLFSEFQKTPQASEDFSKLRLSIEEAVPAKLDFKVIQQLFQIINAAAAAKRQIEMMFEAGNKNYAVPGTGPAPTPTIDPLTRSYNEEGRLIEKTQETVAYVNALRSAASMNELTARTEEILNKARADGTPLTYESAQSVAVLEQKIKDEKKALQESTQSGESYAKTLEKLKEKYENVADPLKKFNDDIAEVEMLYKKGAIGADVYANAVANINKAKQDFIDKSDPMKDQLKELERAFDGFGKKSADAIAEFVVSGKMDFRDLIQSMIKEMISMLVYQNLLKGMFSGMGGNPFAFLFSAMGAGAAGGGVPPSGRAIGGPVSANRPYIVGEKGPELFMSGSSGSIVPNNALGGGVSINIINNSNAQATTQESTDGRGNRKIDVVIGEVVAKQIGQIGSGVNNSLRSTFGSAPALVGR